MNGTGEINWAATPGLDQDGRIRIIEVVGEDDDLNDLTPAGDLHRGLAGEYEILLLWLRHSESGGPPTGDVECVHIADADLPGKLGRLFNRLRPDIVHTHRLSELAAVGQAARKAGVPHLVHSICGELGAADKRQYEQLESAADGLAPVLIVPSEEAVRRLHAIAPAENVPAVIVPDGIDCTRYSPGDPVRARRKVGLPPGPRIVGCGSPVHGVKALLHALFRMPGDVHLTLFGKARPGNEERSMIRRLGLEERVHVLGCWARPELAFQAIDVYFHGPSGECLPRAVLAAQACGKSVIACSSTPTETLCPQTGRIAPIQFVPTLLHGLQRTLDSSAPETTRQFILDNWSIAVSLEKYARLFRGLAEVAAIRSGN